MLSESAAIADGIRSSPVYVPWRVVETACVSQVITDLCACWDCLMLSCRTAKDTSERWYHGGAPRSETASMTGVRISSVVEEGRVEYVPVSALALGSPALSKVCSSPRKRKRKISRSPVKLPRRFEISSLSGSHQRQSLVEDPSFASASAAQVSRGKSRRSGRDRRAAPVFQMGFQVRCIL